MTNAITTPTIESLVATIQVSDKFRVDDYGMHVSGTPSVEEFMEVAYMLGKVRGALAWAVGDYMNAFESHYGETMAQAEVMFPEKSYQYLMDCKWVSSKVVPERRDKGTFSAWKEVLGAKSERLQDKLLDRYNSGDIANQRELRAEAQGEHGRNDSRGNAIDTVKKTINTLQKIFDSDNNLNYMQKGIIEEVIKLLMQI